MSFDINLLKFLAQFGSSVQESISNMDADATIGDGDGVLLKAEFGRGVKNKWGLIKVNQWNGEESNQVDLINKWWNSMDINNSTKANNDINDKYKEHNTLSSGEIENLEEQEPDFDFEAARESTITEEILEYREKAKQAIMDRLSADKECEKYVCSKLAEGGYSNIYNLSDICNYIDTLIKEKDIDSFKEVVLGFIAEYDANELQKFREQAKLRVKAILDKGIVKNEGDNNGWGSGVTATYDPRYKELVEYHFGEDYSTAIDNMDRQTIERKLAALEQDVAKLEETKNANADYTLDFQSEYTVYQDNPTLPLPESAKPKSGEGSLLAVEKYELDYEAPEGVTVSLDGKKLVITGASKESTINITLRAYDSDGKLIDKPFTFVINMVNQKNPADDNQDEGNVTHDPIAELESVSQEDIDGVVEGKPFINTGFNYTPGGNITFTDSVTEGIYDNLYMLIDKSIGDDIKDLGVDVDDVLKAAWIMAYNDFNAGAMNNADSFIKQVISNVKSILKTIQSDSKYAGILGNPPSYSSSGLQGVIRYYEGTEIGFLGLAPFELGEVYQAASGQLLQSLISQYSYIDSGTISRVFVEAQKQALDICNAKSSDRPDSLGLGHTAFDGSSTIDLADLLQLTLYCFDKLFYKEVFGNS